RRAPASSLVPYTTLFRSDCKEILLLTSGCRGGAPHKLPRSGSSTSPAGLASCAEKKQVCLALQTDLPSIDGGFHLRRQRFVSRLDRKSTRLNSSHVKSWY